MAERHRTLHDGDTIRDADAENIADAAKRLQAGELVAFPTETVYGLGADATNDTAVAAIFAAKNRPDFNPLIIHFLDHAAAAATVEFSPLADELAQCFWPGALTLVLKRRDDCPVSLLCSAGLDTLAVRVPDHPVASALLRAAQCPLAAPSANKSEEISPTAAQHVAQSLGSHAPIILDGGRCGVGLESTVVDLSGEQPALLRPGGIAVEIIEAITGPLLRTESDPDAPKSPGQMTRHYAPTVSLRLNAEKANPGEALLAFGPDAPRRGSLNLSRKGDLTEAAANLFAMMRILDQPGMGGIAVMPIPNEGLGIAINDRLKRAAS